MIKVFLEGETYTNPKLPKDIMNLGIGKETDTEVTLAVLWVDRESKETTGGDALTVKKSDFGDWSLVDL